MKYILSLLLVLICISLFGNPSPPRIISEVYIDDSSWWIEICPEYFLLPAGSLITVTTLEDSIQVYTDQDIQSYHCYMISSDDYTLPINIANDLITVKLWVGNGGYPYQIIDYFSVSDLYPNNCIEGQSQVSEAIYIPSRPDHIFVAEATPTPGDHPYQVTSFATISGTITDSNNHPVPNALVRMQICFSPEFQTDVNGHYEMTSVWGCSQTMEVVIDGEVYTTRDVYPVPTQSLTEDFNLENYTVLASDENQTQNNTILIAPNPVHVGKTLKFQLGNNVENQVSIILYNMKGEKVGEMTSNKTSGIITLPLSKKLSSGIYLYRVNDSHKTLAHGKVTVLK